MKMKTLLTATMLSAVMISVTFSARAQNTVITTSADGKTFTSDRTAIDEKGYTRHYVSSTTYVQATPAPTPVPPATNPSKAGARRIEQPAVIRSSADVVQEPVIIVTQSEAEMRAESLAGAARVKAQAEADRVQHRAPKAFRNGE